jgi:hypothetical protein
MILSIVNLPGCSDLEPSRTDVDRRGTKSIASLDHLGRSKATLYRTLMRSAN